MTPPMTEERRVELWHGRDHNGTRSIWAVLLPDGRLKIEGQDLGPGVAIWGEGLSEYEWDWTVAAADVPRLVEILGGREGDDPLALLTAWRSRLWRPRPGTAPQGGWADPRVLESRR